jgi:N-acetylglucosaminyldiphosphoundecaprenol N-acetyl-beta-D-mannosaminyltransferase
MKSKWYELLGVKVNLLSMTQLNYLIAEAVKLNTKWIIANHNLNSLYIYHHNPEMRAFYSSADYIHIDGMALVLLGKFFGIPGERKHRVTYADWIWSLMEKAARENWRVLYLGAKPGVAIKGAKILRDKYPGLEIETIHGYFNTSASSAENQSVLDKINHYQPQVLMIGMGMPRQEQWILENIARIKTNAILPSGACIDYVAGEIATPPRWMGKVGLEWFYRLLAEPRRLWKRYLLEPWFIAGLFFKQYLKSLTFRRGLGEL